MYEAMHMHWKKFGPPVYIAVAAYLGLNKGGTTTKNPDASGIAKYAQANGIIY